MDACGLALSRRRWHLFDIWYLTLLFWIFSHPKLWIQCLVVRMSWGCSWRFQGAPLAWLWYPKTFPTQVKCKNSGGKRWGGAWDATMPLPKPLKSWLWISSHWTSAAMALNMANMPNQGHQAWGGTYTMYICRCCCRQCSALTVRPSRPATIRHVDSLTEGRDYWINSI